VEVVGFAYAKPTIPEALQLLAGEYQENGVRGPYSSGVGQER